MKKAKNTFGIRFLTSGPPGLVMVLNEIIAVLDWLRVQRSVDIDAAVTDGGTLLAIRNPAVVSVRSAEPKTFFAAAADVTDATQVAVTAGAINSEVADADTYAVSDGFSVWLAVGWDADGVTVLTVDVQVGATMPDNDPITSYTLLAAIAVISGSTVVTPLAWNYSQAQACGQDGDGNIVVHYW